MTRWNALVLAASRGDADPVAQAAGVRDKAFARIAGRPMIEHVVAALRAVPEIGDIAALMALGAPEPPTGVLRLDAADGPAASTLAGLDRMGAPLIVTTADHPLLTPGMVADLLRAAEASGADILAGVSPRATVEAAGNPARRTWLRFADGDVSGANLFALATPRARRAVEIWRRAEAERKRPWRMARAIGPGVLARYLAGRLDRAGAARALGRAAGCSAAFAVIDHPDAAHDVDKPADLVFAAQRLALRIDSPAG